MARLPGTAELRTPTIAVAIRLRQIGAAEPTAGELFLPDVVRGGRGALLDDLTALLCSDARFLPVRANGKIRLFAKHAIAWLAVERNEHEAPAHSEPAAEFSLGEEITLYDHQYFVEVELAHGARLVGTLFDSAPQEHSRVADHLNRTMRFLRLWTPDQFYVINVAQVVAVTELGEVW